MLGWGRSAERFGRGRACEMNRKNAAVNTPLIVACTSPSFTPSRYITLNTYAVARQLRPRILNIWRVVTRVLRPWRIMSVVGATDACLAVNGDAIEASPSLTTGARPSPSSLSSSIIFLSFCRCTSTAAWWRLPEEWLLESDFETTLPLEVPSPALFPDVSSADLDFFCLTDFEPSSLDESEEEFPLWVGGIAFRRAIPTWA